MFGVRWVKVAGKSMEPTFRDGEHLLVSLRAYRWQAPRRGDIVLLNAADGQFKLVKRIIGIPGDSVDGRPLSAEEYYVRGDNAGKSTDSDRYGPVARPQILGRVAWRLPSLRRVARGPLP